ncbi:hypothetical protein [Photobacterium phosphoreum]|jgi:POT family proton-dependent oligopeptide transporter|nr:hypothetical protein [Photobacterium phosphoreum]
MFCDLIASAAQYHHVFQSILVVSVVVLVMGVLIDFKNRKNPELS